MPNDRAAARLTDGMVLLGARLREMRKDREERLEDVSASVGLAVPHLSNIERGVKLPSLPALLALADHYEVLVTDLLHVYPFGARNRPVGRRSGHPRTGGAARSARSARLSARTAPRPVV